MLDVHNSIVRIENKSGVPVGAGCLLSNGLILTCAHVVRDALDLRSTPQLAPKFDVLFSFPCVGQKQFSGIVDKWFPKNKSTNSGDIAVIKIQDDFNEKVKGITMRLIEENSEEYFIEKHEYSVMGFPTGYPNGELSEGLIMGERADRNLQIVSTIGPPITNGYSGAPVWDKAWRNVIGIVGTADETRKTAFIIPTKRIVTLWPDLSASIRDKNGNTISWSTISSLLTGVTVGAIGYAVFHTHDHGNDVVAQHDDSINIISKKILQSGIEHLTSHILDETINYDHDAHNDFDDADIF